MFLGIPKLLVHQVNYNVAERVPLSGRRIQATDFEKMNNDALTFSANNRKI